MEYRTENREQRTENRPHNRERNTIPLNPVQSQLNVCSGIQFIDKQVRRQEKYGAGGGAILKEINC